MPFGSTPNRIDASAFRSECACGHCGGVAAGVWASAEVARPSATSAASAARLSSIIQSLRHPSTRGRTCPRRKAASRRVEPRKGRSFDIGLQSTAIDPQPDRRNFADGWDRRCMLDKVLGEAGAAVECAGKPAHACDGGRQLDEAARALAPLGPPVIVFSASHSGSRLLALMLQRLGVFMGSHLNESEDSLDVFDLVRYLVECHAPDYSNLFCNGDATLRPRALAAFRGHLVDRPRGRRWGWKLPETSHVMPVM